MNKNTIVSALFILLAIIIATGSIYLVLSYATDMLNAIVTFVSTNDLSKLDKCGINTPAQFGKLKADLATLILPAIYMGMPLILVVVGALTFLAGFYYHKARHEDEYKKAQLAEREMVHKLVKKIEVEKAPAEPEEPEEVAPAQEPVDEEPEQEAPAPKAAKKKK
jgi:hypothetical protein